MSLKLKRFLQNKMEQIEPIHKIASNDTKNLNKFLNEPNEFKRFILCQMWIEQVFSQSITKNITQRINPEVTNNERLTNAQIYQIFQGLKNSIITENERLKQIEINMSNKLDVMKTMNQIFELSLEKEVKNVVKIHDQLIEKIKMNDDYIDKINNLSENKINEVRNDESQQNSE